MITIAVPPTVPLTKLRQIEEAVPGVKLCGARLALPASGAYLALKYLDNWNTRYVRVTAPNPEVYPVPFRLETASRLRPWVAEWLMPHQREAIAWAAKRSGAFFFHAPGAGKTASALAWALLVPGRFVWVTRAISRLSHRREIERLSTCKVQVVEGFAPVEFLPETDCVILGHEALPHHVDALVKWGFESLVLDELHKLKQPKRFDAVESDGHVEFIPKNNIANAAMRLSKAATRRCGTTATPIKNRVRDLWAQLDLIQPGLWGRRIVWADRYCDRRPSGFGGFDDRGASHQDELRDRLSIVGHWAQAEALYRSLPPMRRQNTTIPLEEQVAVREKKATKALAGRGMLEAKLMLAAARKRGAVLGAVEDALASGQHVVVFTGRRADAEDLARRIKKEAGATPVECVHGGVPHAARDAIRLAYMDAPGASCIVATGDSMGEALDLQRTDLAIFAMLPYTPGQIEQWEGRFVRPGQDRPVLIQYLIAAGTVDEHVAAMLLEKLSPVEKVVRSRAVAGVRDAIMGKSDEEIVQGLLAKLLGKAP